MRTALAFALIVFMQFSPVRASEDADLASSYAQKGFTNVSVTRLGADDLNSPSTRKAATHSVRLTLLQFRNTGWTREQVIAHLKEISRIFSDSCSILIDEAEIVESDPYQGFVDVDWATVYAHPGEPTGHDLAIAKQLPAETPRPVVALMRASYQMYTAYAGVRAVMERTFKAPLTDTVWIMSAVNSVNYLSRLPKRYDPIAHELMHVLGNMPFHNNLSEPNILNDDFTRINDRILPEQCRELHKSNLIHAIPAASPQGRSQ